MKQVVQNMRSGQLSVTDVPAPRVGRGEVLVATKASLISAGTERMLVDFAQKSLISKAAERPDLVKKVLEKLQRDGIGATMQAVFSRLEEPLPLGYSAAGEVIGVGAGLEATYKVGDRVAIAGAGIANHAEVNAVPKNLVVPVPSDVPDEHACFATVVAIAMQGFRNSGAVLGDHVLVIGLGLVGQITVQLASAAGCQVFAVDYDPERVKLAMEGGAHEVFLLSSGSPDARIAAFTKNKGFDAVVVCAATDSSEPVEAAARWARDRATVVLTGKTGTELPYRDYMGKELKFVISRSYGPGRYDPNYEQKGQDYPVGWVRWTERENLAEAVRLMGAGKLAIDKLISHRFDIAEANLAYDLILEKAVPSLGVVLTYPRPVDERSTPRVMLRMVEPKGGNAAIGLIGAGGFARGVLIPALKGLKHVSLTGIVSRGGLSARTAGERFGFAYAAQSADDVLADPNTDAVIIATRHDTHAALTIDALRQGKHVFVEKPLALSETELEGVFDALKTSGKALMVGFNRRFSPYTQALAAQFANIGGPRQVLLRVNAGRLDDGNWQNDPKVGGGRLLGEACHFIDLGCFLAGGKPVEVSATAGQGQDNYAITLRFDNGSLATVLYTSDGDTSVSKEYIEVFGGGAVGVIDNFRTGYFSRNGTKATIKVPGGQNKGHAAEMEAFVAAIRGQQPLAMMLEDIYLSTKATLAAQRAMAEGVPVRL